MDRQGQTPQLAIDFGRGSKFSDARIPFHAFNELIIGNARSILFQTIPDTMLRNPEYRIAICTCQSGRYFHSGHTTAKQL